MGRCSKSIPASSAANTWAVWVKFIGVDIKNWDKGNKPSPRFDCYTIFFSKHRGMFGGSRRESAKHTPMFDTFLFKSSKHTPMFDGFRRESGKNTPMFGTFLFKSNKHTPMFGGFRLGCAKHTPMFTPICEKQPNSLLSSRKISIHHIKKP